MKKLLFVLTFISFAAHAELITQGGFGTDGATGQSIPTKESVTHAVKVYEALDVKTEGPKEKKIVQVDDESSFECEVPRRGIYRITSGCDFTLRAAQKGKVTNERGLAGDLSFSGELAEKVFAALKVEAVVRAGATTKSVANLSCSRVVARTTSYKCDIKGVNVIQMDVAL